MLNDPHLKVEVFEQKSSDIFPGTDIKGGVAVVYWDSTTISEPIGTFTPYSELNSLVKKIKAKQEITLDTIISGRGVYKLSNKALDEKPEIINLQSKGHKKDVGSGAFKVLSDVVFYKEKPNDATDFVQFLGLLHNKREYYWTRLDYQDPPESFYNYKVFIPKANGSGAIGEVLSTPLVGAPLVGATESFLSIGSFRTSDEAENCMKYIKTKFARAALGVLKITQDNTRDKWKYVPMQDFTSNSDIDWTGSISRIDHQLYKKYGLSPEEIEFIETHVKEME